MVDTKLRSLYFLTRIWYNKKLSLCAIEPPGKVSHFYLGACPAPEGAINYQLSTIHYQLL